MNKLTETDILDKIKKVEYSRVEGTTLTFCALTLENGFIIPGDSACVDPRIFDEEKGKEEAYNSAVDKVWLLEGYLLKEKMYRQEFTKKFGMTFGGAIEALKEGLKVARTGWNGKGMWLSLSGSLNGREIASENFWSKNNSEYASENGGIATVLPCITMKTATGEILMGWLASQTDMLASDWNVVT